MCVTCDISKTKKNAGRHVSWVKAQPAKDKMPTNSRMEVVDNASMLLNQLMENYDNRLRPDFGSGF